MNKGKLKMPTTLILCLALIVLLIVPTILAVDYTIHRSVVQTETAARDTMLVIEQLVGEQLSAQVRLLSRMTQGLYSKRIQAILRAPAYTYTDYSEVEERKYLENYLYDLSGMSDYVAGIYVISADNNLYYSSPRAIAPDHEPHQQLLLDEYLANTASDWYAPPHTPWLAYRSEGEQVVTIGRSLCYLDKTPLGIAYIDIPTKKFANLFAALDMPVKFDVYLLGANDEIIASSLPESETNDATYKVTAETGNDNDSRRFVFALPELGWRIVGVIPEGTLEAEVHSLLQLRVVMIVMFVVLSALMLFFILFRIYRPLRSLVRATSASANGTLVPCSENAARDEFGYLVRSYNTMVRYINDLIQQKYELELKRRSAELDDLKRRIDPHFLLNTMQVISASAVINNDSDTENLIQTFCTMLRYSLYEPRNIVPLSEEIAQAEKYCLLRDRAQGRRVTIFYDIPDELYDQPVIKMLLQPIVENCYFHGFTDAQNEKLWISAACCGGEFWLSVRDNGRGMSPERLAQVQSILLHHEKDVTVHHGIALTNVYDRLQLVYGPQSTLTVRSAPGEGTEIVVIIPTENEHGKA